jgi:hypothetical protein
MWNVNARDIFQLRTPGGDRFTEFVDALIRAEAFANGVSQTFISTTLRTNIGDGGVDTQVSAPLGSSGFMNSPTSWQYKATENKNINDADICKEINKSYSKQLIEQGYGYRFCICDDITPEKRSEWEELISEEVSKINPSAPPSLVLTASHLAEWVNRFPALVIRFFKPNLDNILHFQSWKQSITRLIPNYVEVEAWESIKQKVLNHLDWNINCRKVVLSIQGEAGVGKTRFVHETVASIVGAETVVLYSAEENICKKISYAIANSAQLQAILIADECSVEARQRLEDILVGHKDRVRVICVDNSGLRPSSGDEEPWLTRIPESTVYQILEQNFPDVPYDRRRAYVELSESFIRLLADLCDHDLMFVAKGNISNVLTNLRDYLRNRLNPEQLTVINAIALFRKVGFRDEVTLEMDSLCQLLQLDKNKLIPTANKLKDVPGFINYAGRYLYVTPEIVARVAFENAWREWAEHDPNAFLKRIPDILLEAFLQRVSRSASQEVRQTVGEFFRRWATNIQPDHLVNTNIVRLFSILVNTAPQEYLPKLDNLIKQASREQLLQLQETRRDLVWLAEKMARLPELFKYSESILWHLGLCETETSISNNASQIWQGFFRIFLSGTSIPFTERISLLETKISQVTQDEEINLVIGALSHTLNVEGTRIVRSPIIAGEIAPEQWQPKTNIEEIDCIGKVLQILFNLSKNPDKRLFNGAMNLAINNIRIILLYGYLEELIQIFPKDLSEDWLLSLISSLEKFLHYNSSYNHEEIEAWLHSLVPKNFHGKLIEIIGHQYWDYSFRDNPSAWQSEVRNIAQQLCADQELLISELEWLSSHHAKGVYDLGIAMGDCDTDGICFDAISSFVMETSSINLVKPYISSLLTKQPQHSLKVNQWIDQLETAMPTVAFEIFMAGGEHTQAITRAIRLVDNNALPPQYLGAFSRGSWQNPLTTEEFYQICVRLIDSLKLLKTDAIVRSATYFIEFRLHSPHVTLQSDILEDLRIQQLIWQLLEITVTDGYSIETYNWGKIVKKMAKVDGDRAAKIAVSALVSSSFDYDMKDEVKDILIDLSRSYPYQVMKYLGELMLDKDLSWRFTFNNNRELISSLPVEPVKEWLGKVGVEGARLISKNLKLPYIENDKPIVPELTEFVLSQFGNDQETFENFCVCAHSFETFWGEPASQGAKEIQVARQFLDHPLERIRAWAEYEIASNEQTYKYWQQTYEERMIA